MYRTSPIKPFLASASRRFPPPEHIWPHELVSYHILAGGGFAQTIRMQRPFTIAQANTWERQHFNKCYSSYVSIWTNRPYVVPHNNGAGPEGLSKACSAHLLKASCSLQASPEDYKEQIIAAVVSSMNAWCRTARDLCWWVPLLMMKPWYIMLFVTFFNKWFVLRCRP